MRYLIWIFIIGFFLSAFFNTHDLYPETAEDETSYIKRVFYIDKQELSGRLYEYFRVDREDDIFKEEIVYADFEQKRDDEYQEVVEMHATAYTPGPESCGIYADGYTYLEMIADYGIIAVDPRHIELGSIVWVEKYGYAIAADIGGRIKGKKIDLCFRDLDTALRFGRKDVTLVKIF
ncbi:MAG: 3D domain-containing protein [Candidatus Muiribacteriaceae bacterium]